jgi:hypothetical protein
MSVCVCEDETSMYNNYIPFANCLNISGAYCEITSTYSPTTQMMEALAFGLVTYKYYITLHYFDIVILVDFLS